MMSKKTFAVSFFVFSFTALIVLFLPQNSPINCWGTSVYGQDLPHRMPQNSQTISNFRQLPPQQLFDTAKYFLDKNSIDTALICFTLFINTVPKKADIEFKKKVAEAYNRIATIYHRHICDYRTAYEFLIKALILSEEINHLFLIPRIYNNIGNIYYRFSNFDMAKLYYMKALELFTDSLPMVATLNNLGALKLESGRLDSVYVYLNRALKISNSLGGVFLQTIRNNFALYYEKKQQYDLAFYYYRVSMAEAEKSNDVEMIARSLSNLGNLFFLTKQIDSALWYIAQSKVIAGEHGFLEILSDNYRILSQIERSKGRYRSALAYHERYSRLRDSVFNVEVFGDISQLQRLYEVSKTNRQIEQLFIEQQIKQRTIGYLRIILIILFLLTVVLLVSFFQKRKLNTAYQTLFEKNIKIIDIQNSASGKQPEKYKKSAMTDDLQSELLDKILVLMEDATIICDTDFSIDRLAELVQSNQTYVSQAINNVLRKNFRSFLNEYRIREAQRLFSSPDAFKYTIEAMALQVGFKSQSSFRDAFKEVTGVNPNFYLKSMKNLECC